MSPTQLLHGNISIVKSLSNVYRMVPTQLVILYTFILRIILHIHFMVCLKSFLDSLQFWVMSGSLFISLHLLEILILHIFVVLEWNFLNLWLDVLRVNKILVVEWSIWVKGVGMILVISGDIIRHFIGFELLRMMHVFMFIIILLL